jgi:nitrogenase iron protein NifH
MALYAANNLFRGIQKYSNSGGALLGGVIANSINQPYAKNIVDDFAEKTQTQVLEYIPRSVTVTQCELQGKTTIEAAPDSDQARIYLNLAQKIAGHSQSKTPAPLGVQELRDWAGEWGRYLLSLETGEIRKEMTANI